MKADSDQLSEDIWRWWADHGPGDDAIALDGKTLRGAIDENDRQVHVLGACGHASHAPLGKKTKLTVDADAEQKYTNEQGGGIPLLQSLGGQIINKTLKADALLTTREITQHIVANGAHYVCTVKGNQPNLQEAITYYFKDNAE